MKTRLYRHYKNKMYKFLGLVRHSETLEEMALYETLYQNDLGQTWVRPKEMFFGKIDINNQFIDRFAQVELHVEEFTSLSSDHLEIIQQICKACSVKFDPSKTNEVMLFQLVSDLNKPVGFKVGCAESSEIFISQMTAIIPEYHHLGIATGLSERQQQWCQKQKFGKIRSYLFNKNSDMLRLNIKMGFYVVSVDSESHILLEKNI